jgi:lysophospholipid acyltransferase (LPLAT)-like uncharacterized protein
VPELALQTASLHDAVPVWLNSPMAWMRKFGKKPWVQRAIGVSAAQYLRLVWNTSRFQFEPADLYQHIDPEQPFIVAMWHGQHFMVPFLRRQQPVKALISRHSDGEINAIVANRLGIDTIRGSGDHAGRHAEKGGISAYRGMLTALAEGWNVALTADVPKVARVAGLGIVKLARDSGRPIFPVSFATSRRVVLKNWDRSAVNLPFSRGAIVIGEPMRVPTDADDQVLESARAALENALNLTTERAYTIVDRKR